MTALEWFLLGALIGSLFAMALSRPNIYR